MEKYLVAAIGIILVLAVLTVTISIFYIIYKHVLPSVENKNKRYALGAGLFILLVFAIAPCLSLGSSVVNYGLEITNSSAGTVESASVE